MRTLVHSLWQGLLLTILTGGLILLTRRSGAAIRYRIFSGAFLLFILGACFTFAWQWERGTAHVPADMQVINQTNLSPAPVSANVAGGDAVKVVPAYQRFTERFVIYFNEHASFIVTIWFIIFSLRLVKILANLGAMQRIRHYRIHASSPYWKERLQELAELLHIRKPVDLLESELIRVPMMAGIFKPVILLPFSLISKLPAEQLEAILLHELAHIRRRDYFVNLIQSFAEILFFFNPGVLWICSLIREERENCCDDIAVGATGNKKELIHALVSFQEYHDNVHKYSIAFRGSGNHLLQRVKRILYHDNKIMNMREKFFLLCSLLVTAGLLLAFSGAAGPKEGVLGIALGAARMESVLIRDTVPGVPPVQPFAERKDTLSENSDTVVPVTPRSPVSPAAPLKRKTRPSEAAPPARADKGKGSIGNLTEKQHEMIEEMNAMQEKASQLQEELRNRLEEGRSSSAQEGDENVKAQQEAIERQQRMLSEEQRKLAMAEKDLSEQSGKLQEQQRMLEIIPDQPFQSAAGFPDGERFKTPPGFKESRGFKADREERESRDTAKFKGFKPQKAWPARPFEHVNQKFIAPFVADLFEAKLITHTDELSFSLNADSLVVNGAQVRDEEVFQRLRDKYIKDVRSELKYSRMKNGSESTTVNIY
jgi:bla regulator protein BlaR1